MVRNGRIRNNIFACLFSLHNIISLSRHEQVCEAKFVRLSFERYFSNYRATQMVMSNIFKQNMRSWTETIELADLDENKLKYEIN